MGTLAWAIFRLSFSFLATAGLFGSAESFLSPWAFVPSSTPLDRQQTGSDSTTRIMASPTDVNDNQFRVLGVCGGIGSGKSQACKLLVSELGCLDHLDADTIAHSVYSPGSQAVEDIRAEFGDDIVLEGNVIDRKKLGSIVFANRDAMSTLEQIVWPYVKIELQKRISTIKDKWQSGEKTAKNAIVILEAAVLLDADWEDILDAVWVVTSKRDVALKRLTESRGLSEEEAIKRMDAQTSRRGIGNLEEEIKNNVVTAVIKNDSSLEDLSTALRKSLVDPNAWKKADSEC